jgi:predicted component of type VI protein secretion system
MGLNAHVLCVWFAVICAIAALPGKADAKPKPSTDSRAQHQALLDALNRAFEAYLRFKDERDPASWDKEFVADVRKLLRELAKGCDALLKVRGGTLG